MTTIRDRYQQISFRGRLLLLLIAVSLVQGGVAAYTFFQLQSKPAEQRIRAQLNASLRGVAPVVDAELDRSRKRLAELTADPSVMAAIEAGDWSQVETLINPDSGADAADAAVDGSEGAADPPPAAYVVDREGTVVAGTRPDVPVLERRSSTYSPLTRGADLIATIHVPVTFDQALMTTRVKPYAARGVQVFVADDDHIISTRAPESGSLTLPKHLVEGLGELTLDGRRQTALVQPVLEGDVVLGAAIPTAKAAAMHREGLSSFWGFIVLLVVLMIGVSWFITRAVADALRRFSESARALAGGQLARRIPVTGSDEIAVMASAFNDMAHNLELRIDNLVAARAQMRRQIDLFGEALANATDTEEMLQSVCALAMESTNATHVRFWTVDEEGHYEHAACIGLRPGDTEPCGLEKAVPIRNETVRGPGEPWWIVVPARAQDQSIVGLLTLVSTTEAFSAEDVGTAERIAIQAAVAIENARMHERLKLQATRDGLTGLPNHRSLQDELARRLAEARTAGMPLGIAMLDIDNFKRVNDTYGHPVGDEAIKAIGSALAHGVGGMGMVGRYGGEEFVIIMPGCDSEAACRIADRLREDITRIEIPLDSGGVLRVTSSFGIADLDQQDPDAAVSGSDLLHQADVGLYNAKRSGKNRISLAGPTTTVIEMSEVERAKLAARERGDAVAEQAAAALLEEDGASSRDPFDLAA